MAIQIPLIVNDVIVRGHEDRIKTPLLELMMKGDQHDYYDGC